MESNLTSNKSLLAWLDEKVELLKPSNILWIDGSKEQIDALKKEAVETGEMVKLNDELLPATFTEQQKTMLLVLKTELLSAQQRKRMQVLLTTGWLLISATRCFMTLLPAHMKAEQCILSLIQWVLLVHLCQKSVSKSQTQSMLFLI